jgi:ABC-type proline/glycine betaine transport system permease subunit
MDTNQKWKKYQHNDEDVKEYFCGACVAIPLAFVGVGASAYGSSSRGKHKKQKKLALWGGIIVVVISILVTIYYTQIKKCVDCGYTD